MQRIGGRSCFVALLAAAVLVLTGIHLFTSVTAISLSSRPSARAIFNSAAAEPSDAPSSTPKLHVRLYTHNIRFAKTFFRAPNEKPWSQRRPVLMRELLYTAQPPTTFVLLQEVLHRQLRGILSDLRSSEPDADWTFVGVGHDDGATRGKYKPIFFRRAVWHLEANATAWFCEDTQTPGGVCWGANHPRILTIARLRHRDTGVRVVAMNTHLDNDSRLSREMSARIIQDKIAEWGGVTRDSAFDTPVFVGGDFNSPPKDVAYQIMTAAESRTADLRLLVNESRRYGDSATFTGFQGHGGARADDPAALLDFLFLAPKRRSPWTVASYACLSNVDEAGVYMSDHRAVVGDVHLDVPERDATETDYDMGQDLA